METTTKQVRIARIKIRNYRGIEERDEQIAPAGAVIKGRNMAGKTTFIRALRAALAAQDVGPDAIRIGADKAEILVDLGEWSVRRTITERSSSLKVVNKDGDTKASPQRFLEQLVGNAPFDPLDLYLAKPKERRAQILAALPVRVTREQLRMWLADAPALDATALSGAFARIEAGSHGLDVVDHVRSAYYEARTTANAATKEALARLDIACERVDVIARAVPPGAPIGAVATAELRAADAAHKDLMARREAALRARERSAKSRDRIAELRAAAAAKREIAVRPTEAAVTKVEETLHALHLEIADVEARLRSLTRQRDELVNELAGLREAEVAADEAESAAATIDANADALEDALQQAQPEDVTDEELNASGDRVRAATSWIGPANARDDADTARAAAALARQAHEERARLSSALDDVVRRFSNEIPGSLLAASNGIPGLSLDGDDVRLDGVSLLTLSGREQLRFAVDVAKRLNAKSKMLFVDGLERLDPDQFGDFLRDATSGGWQVIATRVERGEIVVEAIASDEEATQQQTMTEGDAR
jgi:hypothetical protein